MKMGSNRHPGEPGYIEPGSNGDEELADVDIGYRGRGRPRLDPSQLRKEKLTISFTVEQLRCIMLAAARASPVPLSAGDWARDVLLDLASYEGEK